MATIDQDLEAAVASLKAYNALATPTAVQQTAQIKLLTQCVARLIFWHLNHPSDTP